MNVISKLQYILKKNSWDAIFVSNPSNIRYLSSFSDGHDAKLLITKGKQYFLTDFRLLGQAKKEAKNFEIVDISKNFAEILKNLLKRSRVRSIAFEAGHMTVSSLKKFRKLVKPCQVISSENVVEELRMIKNRSELKNLKKACKLTTDAFNFLKQTIHLGITEEELAWFLESYLRENGAEALSFPSICASGSNSANPHHKNSSRKFEKGDAIILDFGAVVGGMHADMTRTVFLGKPKNRLFEIYEVVLKAQKKAIGVLKAGVPAKEVDLAARSYIENAGFGKRFGHSTGHGIGFDVHEMPYLNKINEKLVPKNSCVTVEPGIYINRLGGVRIEDDFLVQDKGSEMLTKAPKLLKSMILKV